jgi:hypothetical protein
MNARILSAAVFALLTATAASAAGPSMQYSPVTCLKAGELPLLQVNVDGKGELRAYFRRINSTDWCSVEGVNDGPLSRVVLPKFETNDEIEYFFVLLDGRRVVARSPRIFRARVNTECQGAFARHIVNLSMSCGQDAQGIPSSLGAGYAVDSKLIEGDPPVGSPDRPVTNTPREP